MPGQDRAFSSRDLPSPIQRDALRISAQIRRRIERLAVDRPVPVLAPETWVSEFRRESVVGEFAVARQDFGAGIEPGARGDVDAGAWPLLIGTVRAVRAVVGTAIPIILLTLGLGAGRGGADRNDGSRSKQHHELARSRK